MSTILPELKFEVIFFPLAVFLHRSVRLETNKKKCNKNSPEILALA